MFFFNGQSWTNILRNILDYIRILARIRRKNRILTTPGANPPPKTVSNLPGSHIRTSERAQMGEFGTERGQSGPRGSLQTKSRRCHVATSSTPTRGLDKAVKYRSLTTASLVSPVRRCGRCAKNIVGARNATEADAEARCRTVSASECVARLTQARGVARGSCGLFMGLQAWHVQRESIGALSLSRGPSQVRQSLL